MICQIKLQYLMRETTRKYYNLSNTTYLLRENNLQILSIADILLSFVVFVFFFKSSYFISVYNKFRPKCRQNKEICNIRRICDILPEERFTRKCRL